MKINKIKELLRSKIDIVLNTIEKEDLKERVAQDIYISGGAICSLLLDEKPRDYDIYFNSVIVLEDLIYYYVPTIKIDKQYITTVRKFNIDEKFVDTVIPLTNGACGIKITKTALILDTNLQIVINRIGNINDITQQMDFIHCTNYYDYAYDKLVLNKPALTSILTKELQYQGQHFSINSLYRLQKFIQKGFTISSANLLIIAMSINRQDLTTKKNISKQFGDCNNDYFKKLLEKVEKGENCNNNSLEALIDELDQDPEILIKS